MEQQDNQETSHYILKFYFISCVVGIVTGLVGTAFQLSADYLRVNKDNFVDYLSFQYGFYQPISYLILCILMTLIAVFLVQRFAPEAKGSGVQEIEGALLAKRPIFWRRLIPVKFFAGIFAIGSNLVVGREGPTIQMGGNIGEMLGEKFGLTQEKRNILIGAGAASGLACAFNAPLAGIVFILEEMRACFSYSFLSFKSVAISCVFATIVLRFFTGQQAEINMPVFSYPDLLSLTWFFIFGLIVGVVGLAFNILLIRTLDGVDKLSKKQKWLYVVVVATFIGLFSWYLPQSVGGGYSIISQALHLPFSFDFLILLLGLRFILTLLCYSTGVPGGIFAPMLALGTLLGVAFGHGVDYWVDDSHVFADMFAVAGMGALFAAAIRAPVTGIILIVEMTQNYRLILPSMVACLTATTIVQLAKNPPIYTQLLDRTLRLENEAKTKSD